MLQNKFLEVQLLSQRVSAFKICIHIAELLPREVLYFEKHDFNITLLFVHQTSWIPGGPHFLNLTDSGQLHRSVSLCSRQSFLTGMMGHTMACMQHVEGVGSDVLQGNMDALKNIVHSK